MANISAAEVAKLRKMTGAGMMDCKKALSETNGDFDAAIELLRKKGQKVANNRADREASEGVVLAATSTNNKIAYMVSLNCETDFVAKNEDFINRAQDILDVAVKNNPANIDELKQLKLSNDLTISEMIIEATGVIGEKVELSFYDKVEGGTSGFYIHSDKKVGTIVAMNLEGVEDEIIKNVAMQATAMVPVALDENSVPQDVIEKELEIGKELAINEGKPAEMAEKIARGRLGKFFKESTLLNQTFVKDNKSTVKDYLKSVNKDLTATAFKRFSLRD
ncbi:MAG: elongation factor Ts [Bacteroidales bacterium]|nr:elongation factor Ts [Bacteroidales bacterium]